MRPHDTIDMMLRLLRSSADRRVHIDRSSGRRAGESPQAVAGGSSAVLLWSSVRLLCAESKNPESAASSWSPGVCAAGLASLAMHDWPVAGNGWPRLGNDVRPTVCDKSIICGEFF